LVHTDQGIDRDGAVRQADESACHTRDHREAATEADRAFGHRANAWVILRA
jgi:hypothetical protein